MATTELKRYTEDQSMNEGSISTYAFEILTLHITQILQTYPMNPAYCIHDDVKRLFSKKPTLYEDETLMHFGKVGRTKLALGYGLTVQHNYEEKGVTAWHGVFTDKILFSG